jgi:hypothetical protein
MSDKINANNEDYSPYCPICNSCGEDACCSAMSCQQDPNGKYCETYLKELKFGYLMYHKLFELIDKDERYEKQVDELWDEIWDEIFIKK